MITLLVSMADSENSYAPGQRVSLDKDHEQRLIDSGQAEAVKAAPKKKAKA
jgi:hypothetical protein